jgi:preprotein translocase subunit SecE
MTQTEPKKRTGAIKKTPVEKEEAEENTLARYARETRGEMRKVTWPTREDAIRLTLIVLGFTTIFSLFLGLLDFGWSSLVAFIIDILG